MTIFCLDYECHIDVHLNGFTCQGHENEREKLIMEMEAVVEEHTSLETQLLALANQISSLISDVEEQRAKVKIHFI